MDSTAGSTTSQRISLGIPMSPGLLELLETEVSRYGGSMTHLIRRIIWWHRGVGLPRSSAAAKASWTPKSSDTKIIKTAMLNIEDIEYLDEIGSSMPHARSTVMQCLILQWFNLELYPPRPPEKKE